MALPTSEILVFRALGPPRIEGPAGVLGGAATQRRTVALLAILAVGGDAGVSREKVLELLWVDADQERARHALTQSLYQARRAIGAPELIATTPHGLGLNPSVIGSDVAEFEAAFGRGDMVKAAELYGGAFLDGFPVALTPTFERWASEQRGYFAERAARATDLVAREKEQAGAWSEAVVWLKRLTALQPVRGSVAVRVMRALAETGNREAALQHARVHAALVESELDASVDPDVRALEQQLRDGIPIAPDMSVDVADETLETLAVESIDAEPVADAEVVGESAEVVAASGGALVVIPPIPQSGLRARRRWWALATIVAVCVLVAGLVVWRRAAASDDIVAVAGDVLVVTPFRVTGGGAESAYLSEGVMDLLIATLSSATAGAAADPGALVRAWQNEGGTSAGGVPFARALALARRFHGTQLVGGSVVVTPARLVISGWLANVEHGRIEAQATVEGSPDSVTALIDRLSARLIAVRAGQPARLADRVAGSLTMLRTYLAGLAAYRAGQFDLASRRYASALSRDTTFAEAAVGLAAASVRARHREWTERGLRLAWRARGELSDADRVYLEAAAGPRYPAPSSDRELLAAWEAAVRHLPTRADAWQAFGEALFHTGVELGIPDAMTRAEHAFQRARAFDAYFAPPLPYLVQIAALKEDRDALDALAPDVRDDSSDAGDFARWRLAVARHDASAWQRIRARFAEMPVASLRLIALSAQYQVVGLSMVRTTSATSGEGSPSSAWARADMLHAARTLLRRSITSAARRDALEGMYSAARLFGDSALARETLAELDNMGDDRSAAERQRILDALYTTADTAGAARAARALARARPSSGRDNTRAMNLCVLGHWTLARDSASSTAARMQRSAATLLTDARRRSDVPLMACAALLGAVSWPGSNTPGTADMLGVADSLAQDGAPTGEMRPYLSLVTAHLYMRSGQPDRARAAESRRWYMRGWPMPRTLSQDGR